MADFQNPPNPPKAKMADFGNPPKLVKSLGSRVVTGFGWRILKIRHLKNVCQGTCEEG